VARRVVANSSVLIFLSKIGLLGILRKLFEEVFIPDAVYREVVIEGGERPGATEVKNASWIRTISIKDHAFANHLKQEIDDGEAEAIVLALEIKADAVLLDDADARRIARTLGLNVKGTIGVLLLAWRRGLLDDIKEKIEELMEKGYRLHDKIYRKLLEEIEKDDK